MSVQSAVVDVVGQGRASGPKSAAGRRPWRPPHVIGDLEHQFTVYAQDGAHGPGFVRPEDGRPGPR